MYIYIHTYYEYIHTYIYTYIYIYRERERDLFLPQARKGTILIITILITTIIYIYIYISCLRRAGRCGPAAATPRTARRRPRGGLREYWSTGFLDYILSKTPGGFRRCSEISVRTKQDPLGIRGKPFWGYGNGLRGTGYGVRGTRYGVRSTGSGFLRKSTGANGRRRFSTNTYTYMFVFLQKSPEASWSLRENVI